MNEGTKSVNVRDYYNNGYKEGFQKGKLEKIKEELRFLRRILSYTFCNKILYEYITKRIKQLQKEIGGMK